MEFLAALLVFISVTALVMWLLTARPKRVEERLKAMQKQEKAADEVGDVLRSDSGTFPLIRRLTGSSGWGERARVDLAQAGLTLKVSEYLLARVLLGIVLGAFGALVFSGTSLTPLIVIGLAVLGFMLPAWLVGMRKNRRKERIEKQLPEAVSLMANSLRSGFAFSQAMELAAKQMDDPIKAELDQYLSDVSLGAPSDQALEWMAERVGTYDMDMLVSTILIQRTTGGNLSEILENVADTIRERERLQREVKALTSAQRFAGLILSIYPIFLLLLFLTLSPDVWSILFTDPTGRIVLAVAATLQVLGIVTIRRLLKLEV